MQNQAKNLARRLVPGLLLGFFVLAGLTLIGDLREIGSSLLRFHWGYFLIALAFTLFNYALRFLKWHYYLGLIGVRSLHWVESLRLFVAGFPLALTPGKVGEALKGIWLHRSTKIPVGRGISVVAAERISDGLAVMILSTLGVIAYPNYWPAFVFILVLLLAVVVLIQIRPAAVFVLDHLERLAFLARLAHGIREFYEGSYTLFQPAPTLIAVSLGTISWLGEGIGFYCILLGLGQPPSLELLAGAVFVLSFSTAVGAVSALPGGLGAAEVSIAGMLALIMGMPPAEAALATVLIRLATLWFGVILGMITWSFSGDLLGLPADRGYPAEA